jgi:hypothetical protein
VEHGSGSVTALGPVLGVDRQGLRFLLDLLAAAGVVQENRGDVRLTRRFQTALRYRDLLEVKLDYAGFTINDFADLFTTLIQSGGGFIGKAARALAPGGTLLVFERGALQTAGVTPPMSMLPNLLFFRSYRPAIDYMDQLNALGFVDLRRQDIELDSRFHVVTGRKPDT